jgi:hypothetical protein
VGMFDQIGLISLSLNCKRGGSRTH